MANIPVYENKIFPDASPLAMAARRTDILGDERAGLIRKSGEELQQGVSRIEEGIAQNETAKLVSGFADLQANATVAWQDKIKSADPNDPKVAADFMQNYLQPQIDKLGEGLVTKQSQQLYNRSAAILHMDFFTRTASDQSSLLGQGAVMALGNMQQTLNKVVHDNPSSFDANASLMNTAIDGYAASHRLSQVDVAKIKDETLGGLALQASKGEIENDPAHGLASAEKHGLLDHLTEEQSDQLSGYAERLQKAATADQKRQEAFQAKQLEQHYQDTRTEIEKQYITVDQSGKQVVLPGYEKAVTENMIGDPKHRMDDMIKYGRAIDKAGTSQDKTDPATLYSFIQKLQPSLGAKPLTENELLAAVSNHKLSLTGYNFLRDQMEKPQPETTSLFGRMIDTSLRFYGLKSPQVRDPAVDNAKGQMLDYAMKETVKRLKAGQDPNDFLNPDSKNYILSPGVVKSFLPSPSQQLDNSVRANAPAKVVPGESPEVRKWRLDGILSGQIGPVK